MTEEKRVELYKHVFGSPEGELVLLDILARNRVFRFSDKGSEDYLIQEGRRRTALGILDATQTTDRELKMMLEARTLEEDNYE